MSISHEFFVLWQENNGCVHGYERKLFVRVPGRFSSFLEVFLRFVKFMSLMFEYNDTSYFTMVMLQIFYSEIEKLLTKGQVSMSVI